MGSINLGATGQSDTTTLASTSFVDPSNPSATPLVALGAWNFAKNGTAAFLPGLLPGESVTLTNGGVTVYGIVEQLTSSVDNNKATNWTLAVNVTSFTGTAIGAAAPGGTWTVTTPQTNTLNLTPGGRTSVAAGSNTALFGFTQNGSWFYNGNPADVTNSALVSITAPPVKLITLNGANVSVAPGATLDASGGGDLFAGAFVPGTGGSLNIFAGANKQNADKLNRLAADVDHTVRPDVDAVAGAVRRCGERPARQDHGGIDGGLSAADGQTIAEQRSWQRRRRAAAVDEVDRIVDCRIGRVVRRRDRIGGRRYRSSAQAEWTR
jgi:hypothetical protein